MCQWRAPRRRWLLTAILLAAALLYYITRPADVTRVGGTRPPFASFRMNISGGGAGAAVTRIPRIIHQTWKTRSVPERLQPWVESWVDQHASGGWQYWFWTDADIRSLVTTHYPQFTRLFDSYPTDGYRADAFRYFVLYEYGGVYADLDMQCVRPLDALLTAHACIVSQEPVEHAYLLSDTGAPLVSNALMACVPRHPFFRAVLSGLPRAAGLWRWAGILHATGPVMLTAAYRRWPADGLLLAAPAVFHPTVDTSMIDHMRDKCVRARSTLPSAAHHRVCDDVLARGFRDGPAPESYTDHHWTHLWAGRRYDPLGVFNSPDTFDVRSLESRRHQTKSR